MRAKTFLAAAVAAALFPLALLAAPVPGALKAKPAPCDLAPDPSADPLTSVVVSRCGGVWKCEHKGAVLTLPGDTDAAEVERMAGEFARVLTFGVPQPMPRQFSPQLFSPPLFGGCPNGRCGR